MQERYRVVVLDLKKDDANYDEYENKIALEKIDFIAERIEEVCENFKKTEPTPESMWVVTWREMGIQEPGSEPVSLGVKEDLQEKMQALTKKYPQLVIIAGPLEVVRPLEETESKHDSLDDKLSQVIKYYDDSAPLLDAIKKKKADDFKKQETDQEAQHRAQVQSLKESKDLKGVESQSSTVYVFQGDTYQSHRKTLPFKQTLNKPRRFFRPGTAAKTANPVVTVKHPITKKPVRLGIEICRESHLSYLNAVAGSDKTALQFILSNSTHMLPMSLNAPHVIHADSVIETQLISTEAKEDKHVNVEGYVYKILEKNPALLPLKSYYPLELQIRDLLDHGIKKFEEAYKNADDDFSETEFKKSIDEFKKIKMEYLKNFLVSSYPGRTTSEQAIETIKDLLRDFKKETPPGIVQNTIVQIQKAIIEHEKKKDPSQYLHPRRRL